MIRYKILLMLKLRLLTEAEKNENSLIRQYNTLKKVRDLWTDTRTEVEKTAEKLGEQWTNLNNLLTDLDHCLKVDMLEI